MDADMEMALEGGRSQSPSRGRGKKRAAKKRPASPAGRKKKQLPPALSVWTQCVQEATGGKKFFVKKGTAEYARARAMYDRRMK